MFTRALSTLTVTLCLSGLALAQPATPELKSADVETGKPTTQQIIARVADLKANIVFKTVEGKDLTLDLFVPKAVQRDAYPTVVFVHGGGWMQGSKNAIYADRFAGVVEALMSAGVQVASIDYRLADAQHLIGDLVADCKDSIRFLRKNAAQYKVDADRIGIWGPSAGGHLVLMMGLTQDDQFAGEPALAGTSAKVKFIVSWYGTTDFVSHVANKGGGKISALIGGTPEEKCEEWAKASPVTYLRKDSTPTLLVHGTKDPTVPVQQSQLLLDKAKELEADVQLLLVENAAHNFNVPAGSQIEPTLAEIQAATAAYMVERLK